MEKASFIYHDGGRAAAGYKGKAGDCVTRAIAIITGKPYQEIYDALANGNAFQRRGKRKRRFGGKHGQRSANNGICTTRKWFKEYMNSLGFQWIPTMKIGQGCKVHLRANELPTGKLVVAVSRHFTAVIDGILHDVDDCSRAGTRCVYGYYILKQ